MSEKRHRIVICVLLLVLAALIASAVFIALKVRSSHLEGASVTTELDLVDSCIVQGDTKQALSVLGRAEKRALTAYDRLGIYKRYALLGEDSRAEKCLQKTLRRFPKDNAVLAVYCNFLLRRNRVAEAFKKAVPLSGTEYGSLYAEAVLRQALLTGADADELFSRKKSLFSFFKKQPSPEQASELPNGIFLDNRFIPVYCDAFTGTRISKWIRNAALLLMLEGRYIEAADLYPSELATVHDALFWGVLFYDSARYAESLQSLLAIDALDDGEIRKNIAESAELKALMSDDYYILGDDAAAQAMREEILSPDSPYMLAYVQNKTPALGKLLPLLYMNTALFARNTGNLAVQYERLHELVSYYPLYVPGLAAYGEYALESQRRPKEDALYLQLREAGLRTVGMEERDAAPVVGLDDVLSRIDAALQQDKSPSLIVLREEILAASEPGIEKSEKASRVWRLLEHNNISAALYPPEVMRYALLVLLHNGAGQDAERLFSDYLRAAYGGAEDGAQPAFVEPALTPERLSLWECELAAYFAADGQDYVSAQTLYRYIIDHYSARTPVMSTSGQNSSVVNAYVNLGNIYAGYNAAPQALSMLNKAVARVSEPLLKAEILYRSAVESYCMGNSKDAVRSLQYTLSLNPSHNRARLLLKQIQNAK
ncbi:MAG: hypothetical protein II187_00635 [Treponema sp.]|nr:hypothetical protein [Treponema sp.]